MKREELELIAQQIIYSHYMKERQTYPELEYMDWMQRSAANVAWHYLTTYTEMDIWIYDEIAVAIKIAN